MKLKELMIKAPYVLGITLQNCRNMGSYINKSIFKGITGTNDDFFDNINILHSNKYIRTILGSQVTFWAYKASPYEIESKGIKGEIAH